MTENNLKKMIENHELDNLMTNGEELEKLKSSRTTEQVLEILKKYNYTEIKEVFERELLEILQSIKLNEEEMKNVSGGKVLDKKYLAVLMGGLTMAGATGLPTYAKVEDNRGIRKELETGVLNTVDKNSVGLATASFFVGVVLVEALNLMCRKPKIEYREKEVVKEMITEKTIKDEHSSLTEEQQKIYENTKKLSAKILKYVGEYIHRHKKMPDPELTNENPDHKEILRLIKEIRTDWLNMYEHTGGEALIPEEKDKVLANQRVDEGRMVYQVQIDEDAVELLFYDLPVGKTYMDSRCCPEKSSECTESEVELLSLLWRLETKFRSNFLALAATELN